MADDYAGSRATTGRVTVGNPVTGTIESAGDQDWFAVELEGGVEYRIDLEGAPTGAGTLADPFLRWLHDANGAGIRNTRDHDGGEGANARQVFRPDEGGTYYISANGAGSHTGTYRLSVTQIDPAPGGDDDDSGDVVQLGVTHVVWTGPEDGDPGDATPVVGEVGVTVATTRAPDPPPVVSVSEGDADLPTDRTTTGVVAVGGSVTGTIGSAGDRDWFAVALEAGVEYRIDLEGAPTRAGTLADPHLRWLHDADGAGIRGTRDRDSGVGANARQVFTPEEDGTYYISANGAGGETGTYRLSVTRTDLDLAHDRTTTGRVVAGGWETGRVESAGDEDWFAVELEAGKTYRFDLDGSGEDALADPELRGIHDATGALLDDTDDNDSGWALGSRVAFTAPATATHYVAVGGHDGATGGYTLSVIEVVDDYAADKDTAGVVTVGGSVEGEIEINRDRDWYAVELEAGKTYRVDIEGRGTFLGTLNDPVLGGIFDADENPIANTGDDFGGTGLNAQLYFTPDAGGTHYIEAGADAPSWFGGEGTYRVSVTETPDRQTEDTTTSGVVAVGGSVEGDIERGGDRDWYAVEMEAGRTYRFDLWGRWYRNETVNNEPAGSLSDPMLHGIHDRDGHRIDGTGDDNGGLSYDSLERYTAEEDGVHYVAAGSARKDTGIYRLSVTDETDFEDDYAGNIGTEGTVTVGGSEEGAVQSAHERDWFAVELEAGKTYRFDLEGTGDDALSDPVLRGIHDANGALLDDTADTTDDDDTDTDSDDSGAGASSRMHYTAETDDTYYVAVGALDGATGTYTLSVVEVLPSLRVEDAEGTEGEDTEIVFRVTLDRVPSEEVTVPWETRDGTAEAGADYVAATGTLTFAPGETEKTVSVTLIDDTHEDSGETFTSPWAHRPGRTWPTRRRRAPSGTRIR